jgi:hypothetical protein
MAMSWVGPNGAPAREFARIQHPVVAVAEPPSPDECVPSRRLRSTNFTPESPNGEDRAWGARDLHVVFDRLRGDHPGTIRLSLNERSGVDRDRDGAWQVARPGERWIRPQVIGNLGQRPHTLLELPQIETRARPVDTIIGADRRQAILSGSLGQSLGERPEFRTDRSSTQSRGPRRTSPRRLRCPGSGS